MKSESITDYLKVKAERVNVEIKKYLTDRASQRYLESLLGRSGYEYDKEAINRAVLEPSKYLLELGGKRWRSTLMLTVIDALGKNSDDYIEFSIIPEVVHNGTLIHDDIEDGSAMRRGSEAVHRKYGLDVALNLGDFMFYFPIIALLDSKKVDREVKMNMLEVYQREMLKLSIGQATDIAWHRGLVKLKDVSEMQYMQTAYSKTGVLSSMAAKMGAVLCGAEKKVVEAMGMFGASIGVAFQLQDDILNLNENGLSELKGGVGEDVTEGKVTLLMIKTVELADQNDREKLIAILDSHTKDGERIKEAIAIVKRYKAEDYIKELEWKILRDAWAKVDRQIPDSPSKKKLKEMAEFLINRNI